MKNVIKKLQKEIRTAAINEGGNKTNVPFVTAYRFTTQKIQMPQTENPYLYIILDGALRLYTPSGIMDYMSGQYSISKIDTPLSGTVLTFSDQQDFLATAVEFTTNDVITTVLDLDNDLIKKITDEKLTEQELFTADNAVIQSFHWLFSQCVNPFLQSLCERILCEKLSIIFFAVPVVNNFFRAL